jgi:hypothetical protein
MEKGKAALMPRKKKYYLHGEKGGILSWRCSPSFRKNKGG